MTNKRPNKTSPEKSDMLKACLRDHFSVDDPEFHTFIEKNCEYVDLFGGDELIRQGDKSDDVFFVLSGHLRAYVNNGDTVKTLGDIGRGETVGELAMFTEEPRMASVVATRNSVVVRLSRDVLEKALQKNPGVALKMTKHVIDRFRRSEAENKPPNVPVTITVFPISKSIDVRGFVEALASVRQGYGGDVAIVDEHSIRDQFGVLKEPDIWQPRGPVSLNISDLELNNETVFFIADPDEPIWSQTALHHSDEILLLANAGDDKALREAEVALLKGDNAPRARKALILLHPDSAKSPRDTASWLKERDVQRHFHMRYSSSGVWQENDMRRLARILSGNAVGLVLSGGGARGFAHIGIAKALYEAGIEIDFIGGTSAGAIMGSWVAMEVNGDDFVNSAREIFVNSPVGNISGDFNPLPIVSLIKGKRANFVTRKAVLDHTGADIDLEDSWKTFFVVSSNYSTQTEQVLTHGNFTRNVMASFSIPGLLPPTLIDGQLMYDGGSFNNFPVDVMRRMGAGKIIGVDLLSDYVRTYEMETVPTPGAIFRDRFRSRKKQKIKLPSLPDTLLTASFITSMARQKNARQQVDLLFKPNIRGVGMLDWKKYDRVVKSTYEEAREQLEAMDTAELEAFTR